MAPLISFPLVALGAAILLYPPHLAAQNPDRVSGARAQAVLKQGASDSDPETRREVAVALSLIGAKDPTSGLLEPLARDKDHLVREAAIVSIGELRDQRLLKLVRDALDDDTPEVAFAAARTLFRLRDAEGKQLLVAVVEKEAKARSGFLRAKLRDVARRMKTPKSALVFVAQQGAGFVPLPGFGAGLSAMGSMLGDADFSARATALLMLSTDRSPELRPLMAQAFMDEDWSMRAAAVQIAAQRKERPWRTRLVPLRLLRLNSLPLGG